MIDDWKDQLPAVSEVCEFSQGNVFTQLEIGTVEPISLTTVRVAGWVRCTSGVGGVNKTRARFDAVFSYGKFEGLFRDHFYLTELQTGDFVDPSAVPTPSPTSTPRPTNAAAPTVTPASPTPPVTPPMRIFGKPTTFRAGDKVEV